MTQDESDRVKEYSFKKKKGTKESIKCQKNLEFKLGRIKK